MKTRRGYTKYICPDIDIHTMPVEDGFALSGNAGEGSYGELGEPEIGPYSGNY
ncbi:MAG: hypothetical protein IIX04_06905 [Alistipes sp.]|nr:hypothetical protein [Alistipes sp.]MBR0394813.1 hypothetical protein [Alistipes sp.]